MTEVTVEFLGGPKDGKREPINFPKPLVQSAKIRSKQGVTYRVRQHDGRTYLVHPSAQACFWEEEE